MFDDIVQPSIRVGSRRTLALPLSIVTHLLAVAIVLIIPLMVPGVLPTPTAALIAFVSGDVALPSPPALAPRQTAAPNAPRVEVHSDAVPLEAPSAIAPEIAVESAPLLVGTIEGGGNLLGEIAEHVAPPPPPPSLPEPTLRVGGDVRPPTRIKDVRPEYPAIARAAHVEGIVIIEATIGPTGKVMDTKLLRSIPLLDDAALDAVRRWEYTPTLLNGSPVSVVMTVTVNFTLK